MTYQTLVLLLTPVAAGVAAGYGLGGRLAAVATVRLRALWLLWLAAAVQACQYYADPIRKLLEERIGVSMVGIVFAIVALWLAVNLRQQSWLLRIACAAILLGAALNGAAILANGRMPYSGWAADAAGAAGGVTTPKNEPADSGTRLAFIGDVVPVPPLRKIISPGDILIGLGAATSVAAVMRRTPRTHRQDDQGGRG